jgi:hypothetical protein
MSTECNFQHLGQIALNNSPNHQSLTNILDHGISPFLDRSFRFSKISLSSAVSVIISLQREAAFGFQYALVGADPALGDWDPTQAAVFEWSEGHVWSKRLVRTYTGRVLQVLDLLMQRSWGVH